MKITGITNKCEVLSSGTVQTFDEQSSMELHLDFDETFKITIVLEFDTENNKTQNLATRIEGNKITFICTNFDNVLGTGTTNPLSIAVYKTKNVFFSFWVYSVKDHNSRKIDYCIYREL